MGFNFTTHFLVGLRLTRDNVSGFPWAGFLEPFSSQVGVISLGHTIIMGQNWMVLISKFMGLGNKFGRQENFSYGLFKFRLWLSMDLLLLLILGDWL